MDGIKGYYSADFFFKHKTVTAYNKVKKVIHGYETDAIT